MQRVVVTERVVAADLDDETVLLDLTSGKYYGLAEVGRRIWTLLGEGQDVETIVAQLADEYEAAPGELRRDVTDFVEALVTRGLARPAAAQPA